MGQPLSRWCECWGAFSVSSCVCTAKLEAVPCGLVTETGGLVSLVSRCSLWWLCSPSSSYVRSCCPLCVLQLPSPKGVEIESVLCRVRGVESALSRSSPCELPRACYVTIANSSLFSSACSVKTTWAKHWRRLDPSSSVVLRACSVEKPFRENTVAVRACRCRLISGKTLPGKHCCLPSPVPVLPYFELGRCLGVVGLLPSPIPALSPSLGVPLLCPSLVCRHSQGV